MARRPVVYARLLREKMERHETRCVLLNTGWSGGRAGEAERISIRDTRTLLNAAFHGELPRRRSRRHPIFGLRVPERVAGVNPEILDPRRVWKGPEPYEDAASRLRDLFRANFEKNRFGDFGIRPVI